jgi:hypothetical protein
MVSGIVKVTGNGVNSDGVSGDAVPRRTQVSYRPIRKASARARQLTLAVFN